MDRGLRAHRAPFKSSSGRSVRIGAKRRHPNKVNAIIESAINKIYLKAEQPDVAAVKAGRRQDIRQSRRRPRPFENHNQPVLSIRK
jgi:hypothetical protein